MGAALSTTGAAAGKGRALSGAASRAKERARVWLVPRSFCDHAVFCTQQYRPCGQISCASPAGWNVASTAEPEPAKFLASWLAGSAVFSCARSPDFDGDSHTAHKSQSLASLPTLAVLSPRRYHGRRRRDPVVRSAAKPRSTSDMASIGALRTSRLLGRLRRGRGHASGAAPGGATNRALSHAALARWPSQD